MDKIHKKTHSSFPDDPSMVEYWISTQSQPKREFIMEFGESWEAAIVAFGVVSGAINFVVGALNATLKKMAWYDSAWYARLQPWVPGLVGIIPGVLVGPVVVPIDLPLTVHISAGILIGALSTQTYKIWEQSLKGRDARIEFAQARERQDTPPELPSQ